jgi:hypothetical protein
MSTATSEDDNYIWHGDSYHKKGARCNQCAPQPAPDAGEEWCVHENKRGDFSVFTKTARARYAAIAITHVRQ